MTVRIRVKGTKVIFKHNYVPRWLWIVSLLIMWNALLFGFYITQEIHPAGYALVILGVVTPITLFVILSENYIITNKEIVVVKHRRIAQRLKLDDTIDFRSTETKAYIFSLGQPVGDIEVFRVDDDRTVLVIKGVREPEEKIRYIKTELKKSKQ